MVDSIYLLIMMYKSVLIVKLKRSTGTFNLRNAIRNVLLLIIVRVLSLEVRQDQSNPYGFTDR